MNPRITPARGAPGWRSHCPLALLGATVLAIGCYDAPAPSGSGLPPLAATAAQVGQDSTPTQEAVAAAVPGFGGYFLDSAGRPTVYLTDPTQRPTAELALAAFMASRGFTASDLQVWQADYDYVQLDAWYREAWPAALAVSGAVFSDIDEGANRLRFGAEAGAVASVQAALAATAVPSAAMLVEATAPIAQMVTLRDTIRPVQGGWQINFLDAAGVRTVSFICTMGFNAVQNDVHSFVTNSHCTNVQGGEETPTQYYQPLMDPDGDRFVNPDLFIGVEVDDPHYWISLDCPIPGFMCRYSDAARGEYAEGQDFALGRIARTVARDTLLGTLDVDPKRSSFQIVAEQANSVMGEEANKVGRTTGWTYGPVIATCINSIVLGSTKPIIQLCQTRVRAGVNSGDSGSPVFRIKGNGRAVLLGILWGGSVSGTPSFVFSPLSGVERELGPLQTF
jgi:hypothetical protein